MHESWQADITIDNATVQQFLAAQHPELAEKPIRKFDAGWDNDLYLIGDHLLFRFTKRAMAIPFSEREMHLLPLLADHLPIPVPKVRLSGYHQGEYPYIAYPMLPGEIAAQLHLSEEERGALVSPLAGFLAALHQLPVSEAARPWVVPDTLGRLDIAKRMGQIREKMAAAEQIGVPLNKALLDELAERLWPADVERVQCLVHGDLYTRNLLLRDRAKLSGVIDWGDIHWGNPAKDLSFAVSFFPPTLFTQFARSYPIFQQGLFFLATMSAINHTLHLTEFALAQADEVLQRECAIGLRNAQENFRAFKHFS